jgi:hypothetical protein
MTNSPPLAHSGRHTDVTQGQLFEPDRDAYWCPRNCKKRCGPGTCVCPRCFCPACRVRAQLVATATVPFIDLPPRAAFQPRLFPYLGR